MKSVYFREDLTSTLSQKTSTLVYTAYSFFLYISFKIYIPYELEGVWMNNFIIDQTYQETGEETSEHEYANITFRSMDKMKCRGRHLFVALWILSLWRGLGADKGGWFFVSPHILDRYAITPKEFYRAKNRLVDMGIIEIRYKCGPGGTNFYRFRD